MKITPAGGEKKWLIKLSEKWKIDLEYPTNDDEDHVSPIKK